MYALNGWITVMTLSINILVVWCSALSHSTIDVYDHNTTNLQPQWAPNPIVEDDVNDYHLKAMGLLQ